MTDDDPWAYGTRVTPGHPLWATVAAWAEIERTLAEWGIPDAEARSKAIVARLAHLDPPVLLVTAEEMKREDCLCWCGSSHEEALTDDDD